MIIKIGQLETFITLDKKEPCISFGVKEISNPLAAEKGEHACLRNRREIKSELWWEAMEGIQLTDLFYNEENGLFKNDADISPLTQKHLRIMNRAYDFFMLNNEYDKKQMSDSIINNEWTLKRAEPSKEESIKGHISWLNFWMNYAYTYCSKPVIANVNFKSLDAQP